MNPKEQYQQECEALAAKTALGAAEDMPVTRKVMLYRGIISLLPAGSEARSIAESAATSLESAERSQLRLFEILEAEQ